MPVPQPRKGEKQDDYMERCMHEVSKNKDRDNKQNVAICMDTWRKAHASVAADAGVPAKAGGKMTSLTLFARKTGKIDAAKGIIYGVSVISGSVATLQVPRDRLAGCSSWHLRFVVYSSGGNLNRR
jgi:hypothetical protein